MMVSGIPSILRKQFGLLAGTPKGVDKLRKLILGFAVRGRLLPQNAADDPVSHLIDRSSFTRSVSNSVYSEVSEPGFAIPPSWEWVYLDQIVDLEIGRTPSTRVPRYWGDDGIPWVSIADMPGSGVIVGTKKTVTEAAVVEVFKRPPAPKGTLLMSFKLSIGKVGFLQFDAYHNEAIVSILPRIAEISEYLHLSLRAIDLLAGSAGAIKGRTLNKASLCQLAIPLPPLAEQRRIVAKVDELMVLCDELEERQGKLREVRHQVCTASHAALTTATTPKQFAHHWTRIRNHFDLLYDTPQNVKELRQLILQLAVQGKLVEQDPDDEPAETLLAQIWNKGAIELGKDERSTKAEDNGCPEPPSWLPTGWTWARMADVFDVSGGITKNSTRKPVKHFYPYLRVANVQRGRLALSEIEYFELFEGELARWRLAKGDLLVVEGNGSEKEIGRCALWDGEIDDCVHQNHIIRCRPLAADVQQFVITYLNSPVGIAGMKALAITTSGLYSLSVGKVRGIPVPIPPLAEQKRIVAKVDQLMALCDELESKLTQSQADSEKLVEAVVHHLLNGNE